MGSAGVDEVEGDLEALEARALEQERQSSKHALTYSG